MALALVGADELPHLRIDDRLDLLLEEPLAHLLEIFVGPALPRVGADLQQIFEAGATEARADRDPERAHDVGKAELALAELFLAEEAGAVTRDERAVEVEAGGDTRAAWTGLDLGD